jgi:hypothetical protein
MHSEQASKRPKTAALGHRHTYAVSSAIGCRAPLADLRDGLFGEAAASSNGGAAGAGEVVSVGASDAFDDAELTQTGEAGGKALGEQRPGGRCGAGRRC